MSAQIQEEVAREVARRRTFAIVSHPDAGKTTLTEKLLWFGGAIQVAGAVRARKASRHAVSDWMQMERERGISVTTSVMSFEYPHPDLPEAPPAQVNLLDTPGHEDFSEDTYRTLTAVDSAIMVLDAAKGIEPQTRKLFEVCRLRDMPIITFVNKLDREARDPFELMDEVEQFLGQVDAHVEGDLRYQRYREFGFFIHLDFGGQAATQEQQTQHAYQGT